MPGIRIRKRKSEIETRKPKIMKEIKLKQYERQDLLEEPPHILIRFGSVAIAGLMVLLLVFSYFLRYPDIISAPILLTTEHLPARLEACRNGSIACFLVEDKQQVAENEMIAVLKSSAEWKDILWISDLLDSLFFWQDPDFTPAEPLPVAPLAKPLPVASPPARERKTNVEELQPGLMEPEALQLEGMEALQLGELQQVYNQFVIHYHHYLQFRQHDSYEKKKEILNKEIAVQRQIKQFAIHQLQCQQRETNLRKQRHRKDSLLYVQQHLSFEALEKTTSDYLQSVQSTENQKQVIANINLQLIQLESQLLELEKEKQNTSYQYYIELKNAADLLKAEIKAWKQQYLIESPIEGTISLAEFDQADQLVSAGDVIAVVIPTEKTKVVGKIELQAQGAGKVREGQQAYIHLTQFPHMEYGSIPVTIQQMSLVPVNKGGVRHYLLKVQIPFPLRTNYHINLPYMQEMEGSIEIVTAEKRLIEKMLLPLRKIYRERLQTEEEVNKKITAIAVLY